MPEPDRWCLRERSGLAPNQIQNWEKIILESMEEEVFLRSEGRLSVLTWEHPKNCIYVTWVMKRPNGLWEGFYHLRHCHCSEWDSGQYISPGTSIWEQSSCPLNQLWFIQEKWKMKWANFPPFPFFSPLSPSTTFALVMRLIQRVISAKQSDMSKAHFSCAHNSHCGQFRVWLEHWTASVVC